jgi:SAM-dependent methyltransferase
VAVSVALDRLHGGYVHPRRVRVLADAIAPLIPPNSRLLDVGCGDGLLAHSIAARRPDVRVTGVDVLVREGTAIPVHSFDGHTLPYDGGEFDAVMSVDVLHHSDAPEQLLTELARVGRTILLKDHLRDGWLAAPTLRAMDRVSNSRYGVALPFNYLSRREWDDAFERLGLLVERWLPTIPLYPAPASWLFGRGLHFIARLRRP